jgi:hypothetical protein
LRLVFQHEEKLSLPALIEDPSVDGGDAQGSVGRLRRCRDAHTDAADPRDDTAAVQPESDIQGVEQHRTHLLLAKRAMIPVAPSIAGDHIISLVFLKRHQEGHASRGDHRAAECTRVPLRMIVNHETHVSYAFPSES